MIWRSSATPDRFVFTCGLLLAGFTTPPATAQDPDSARAVPLTPVVVTAERTLTPLMNTTSAVTRLSGEELRALPARTVADALRTVPGLVFVDTDGSGADPQLMVRGFYGGGEAEYMVVLVDGQPINAPESGLVNWDLIPIEAVEAIEVVRGGASSLYGDAAVGGVINLVTRRNENTLHGSITAGEPGVVAGAISFGSQLREKPVSIRMSARRSAGFRDHAERNILSFTGSATLLRSSRTELSASTLHHLRDFEEPGPRSAEQLTKARTAVHPFYRFDASAERSHLLTLSLRQTLASATEGKAALTGELRDVQQVRTLPLSPAFVDTKERSVQSARLLGSAQVHRSVGVGPGGAVLLGADWSAARLDSRHFMILMGDSAAYADAEGSRGELDASGRAHRVAAALFARYEVTPVPTLRLTVSTRLDWLNDQFEPGTGAGNGTRRTHTALSPQIGLNLRYLQTVSQQGNVFVSVGRSFKAPTPDQLFDQRTIPVPFEPYRITLANADLRPQRGTSMEAGLYHGIALPGRTTSLLGSLTAYQVDMVDELDVDLQAFRYVNIGRSRHRGVEGGFRATAPLGISAYGSYTLQAVTFRYGDNHGNALKAIPRHAVAGGLAVGDGRGLAASVSTSSVWGIWLDDANTIPLPGYSRVDAAVSYGRDSARLSISAHNLLNDAHSTTGFPDPAGSGITYYYPAAPRMLEVSLSVSR